MWGRAAHVELTQLVTRMCVHPTAIPLFCIHPFACL